MFVEPCCTGFAWFVVAGFGSRGGIRLPFFFPPDFFPSLIFFSSYPSPLFPFSVALLWPIARLDPALSFLFSFRRCLREGEGKAAMSAA